MSFKDWYLTWICMKCPRKTKRLGEGWGEELEMSALNHLTFAVPFCHW